MSGRVSGYHYEVGADGKKRRVYSNKKVKAAPAVKALMRQKAATIRGSGGYYQSNFVKRANKIIPKGAFSKVGGVIGGLYGAPGLGSAAGSLLSKIAGFGAYRVKSNSLINEGESPAYMHSSNSSLKVRHREYIADVTSSSVASAFSNVTYALNPGLSNTFPWLSSIAQQYEQYRISGMIFEFKSLSADTVVAASTNTYIGGVVMATNYNAVANAFTSKQQMENAEYTTSCKPSECVYHPIECAPVSVPTNQLYVRTGAIPSNADLRMYDLGLFQIATFGVAATNVILGELWCTYEIEFTKPISNAASGNLNLTDHFKLTGVTNALPLGTNATPVANSSIGGVITTSGTSAYTFPSTISSGTYLINYTAVGSSVAQAITAPSNLVGCSLLQLWQNDTGTNQNTSGQTGAQAIMLCIIKVTAPNASWQLVPLTLPSSVTAADLWVTQIDADIVA